MYFVTNPDKAASVNSVPSAHVETSDYDMVTGWDILSLGGSQWYFAWDSGLQSVDSIKERLCLSTWSKDITMLACLLL